MILKGSSVPSGTGLIDIASSSSDRTSVPPSCVEGILAYLQRSLHLVFGMSTSPFLL